MTTSVFCIAASESKANEIVSRLKSSGFGDSAISVLFPDNSTKASKGAVAGASTGGALRLLVGTGPLVIPGVGPSIVAGPLKTALSGEGIGASVGGITGTLVGMDIPEPEAKCYEGKVKEGNILISAHSESADEIKKARNIFEKAGATDIGSSSEPPAPIPMPAATRMVAEVTDVATAAAAPAPL